MDLSRKCCHSAKFSTLGRFVVFLFLSMLLSPFIALASGRFIDNNNGTVTDTITGQIWLKDADCASSMEFRPANDWSAGLSSGMCGLSDGSKVGEWHLPTADEFAAIIDPNQKNPALALGHPFVGLGNPANIYWTSTGNILSRGVYNHGYAMDVASGGEFLAHTSSIFAPTTYYAWPVRAPKVTVTCNVIPPGSGSVSASTPSPVQVNLGSTAGFIINANPGYYIATATGCGMPSYSNSDNSVIYDTFQTAATTGDCALTVNLSAITVNGACGASDRDIFTLAPATNLCSIGTASSVTGSGPWNWTCAGSIGGTGAYCSANKTSIVTTGSNATYNATTGAVSIPSLQIVGGTSGASYSIVMQQGNGLVFSVTSVTAATTSPSSTYTATYNATSGAVLIPYLTLVGDTSGASFSVNMQQQNQSINFNVTGVTPN